MSGTCPAVKCLGKGVMLPGANGRCKNPNHKGGGNSKGHTSERRAKRKGCITGHEWGGKNKGGEGRKTKAKTTSTARTCT